MSEGVFSKSIRDGFSDQSDIFGSGANYGNMETQPFEMVWVTSVLPIWRQFASRPAPSIRNAADYSAASHPTADAKHNFQLTSSCSNSRRPLEDFGSSIAAPGVQGIHGSPYQHSYEQLGTDSNLPPEVPPALPPSVQLPEKQSNPFSSVPPNPVGPGKAQVTEVEVATPAGGPPAPKPDGKPP